jgi:peptidoglycan/LPS O-acetylase OafA/YrhL
MPTLKDFEHQAAYVIGVALPVLEVARRRTDFSTISGYLDDFVAGGLLLLAATLVSRGHPRGRAALVAAWGILCGGLYNSFFGQLESARPTDVSGLPSAAVIAVKGALYAVALYALNRSVRRIGDR